MKRRGFTLIELLAVIVILAIIALIATPIVLDIIEDSKESSVKRSIELYLDGVEQAIARYQLNGKTLSNGTYYIMENGNLCSSEITDNKCTEIEIKVTVEGNKPTSGRIVIKDGQVQTTSTMIIGDYEISYNDKEKDYVMKKLYKGILCTAKTEVTTGNVPSGNYAYGDEYTCELGDNDSKTFFVLETNGDNVFLIMNANIDSNGKAITPDNIPDDNGRVECITESDWKEAGGIVTDEMRNDGGWCQNGICFTTEFGPLTANKVLKTRTSSWTKLNQSQISLPSASQVATASGKTFDASSTSSISGLSTWLYDYLDSTTNSVSSVYGYWTATASNGFDYHAIWSVGDMGTLWSPDIIAASSGNHGLRPVITISKAQLN